MTVTNTFQNELFSFRTYDVFQITKMAVIVPNKK